MMKVSPIAYLLAVVCIALTLQCRLARASEDELPAAHFNIPAPESASVQAYLGLDAIKPFTIRDVKAKIVIVEFLSADCPHCRVHAPVMNRLYRLLREDHGLSGVKLIGIAVGSEKPRVDAFRRSFRVRFPIFIDEDFSISASMDGVATPTTMMVSTKDEKVLSSHVGVIKDFKGYVKELRKLLKDQ